MAEKFPSFKRLSRELPGPLLILALAIFLLHKSLFSGGALLPSHQSSDLHLEFLGWRHFGFTQWLTGHFPFWNPHEFCGYPFFSQIQSCMLYPIAWINFLCNTATATVIEIVLDLTIAGACTYAWARQRGISRLGATLAGAAFAFSGPVYIRITAGHMTPLATLSWMPLTFLATDQIIAGKYLRGTLIGAVSICLQWLGGHPQLVYYTALSTGLYLLLFLPWQRHFFHIAAVFTAMWMLGSSLAAVQVIPAILASTLSVRSGHMLLEFASSYSYPPENLLTLFVPYPLGDGSHMPYVGRWLIWEVTAYFGVINLMLAITALSLAPREKRWRYLLFTAVLTIVMLGSYTPVYIWLYQYFPKFDNFRGVSKFVIPLVLILSILAGEGFDHLRKNVLPRHALAITLAALIFFLLGFCFLEFTGTGGPMQQIVSMIVRSATCNNMKILDSPNYSRQLAPAISIQWFIAGTLTAATALIFFLRRWARLAACLLMFLSIVEVCFMGSLCNVTNPWRSPAPQDWENPIWQAMAADNRLIFLDNFHYSNSGNLIGANTIWGYDPAQPRQYSDLIAAMNHEPTFAGYQYDPRHWKASPLEQLLRCQFALQYKKDADVYAIPEPMPHLKLMGAYVLATDPKDMRSELLSNFDFRRLAMLETKPNPEPSIFGPDGHVKMVQQSINDLEIVADIPAPALLLITDNFAPGWQIRTLETNSQQSHYDILRADYTLRAIPLAAGHHHFDMYYWPPGLWAGISISVTALVIFAAALATAIFRSHSSSMH